MEILFELVNKFQLYLVEKRDPRYVNKPLTSMTEMTLMIVVYLAMVKYGPILMKNRRPFQIKGIMKIYNIIQVILNSTLFMYGIYIYRKDYNYECQGIDYDTDGIGMQEAFGCYCYYLLKCLDLCDTLFFVLNKKQSHITLLHVYHHTMILISSWMGVAFFPGGHVVMIGLFNSFVHILMYGYYYLSIVNENIRKTLWLKKRLTQVQMIQFALLTIHTGRAVLFGNCNISKSILFMGVVQNLVMLIMFSNFYRKTYLSKKKLK